MFFFPVINKLALRLILDPKGRGRIFDANSGLYKPFDVILGNHTLQIVPDKTGCFRGEDEFDDCVVEVAGFAAFGGCEEGEHYIEEVFAFVGDFVEDQKAGHVEFVDFYHLEADFYQKPDELRVEVVHLIGLDVLLVCFEDFEEVFDLGRVVFLKCCGSKLLNSYFLEHVHEK